MVLYHKWRVVSISKNKIFLNFSKKLKIFSKKLLTNEKRFGIIGNVNDAGVAQWQSS